MAGAVGSSCHVVPLPPLYLTLRSVEAYFHVFGLRGKESSRSTFISCWAHLVLQRASLISVETQVWRFADSRDDENLRVTDEARVCQFYSGSGCAAG